MRPSTLEQVRAARLAKAGPLPCDFIQCLGSGFCFVGNQHRIEVGGEEFFADLLFFQRDLKALIVIELKKGKFKPAYLGQLNFYLSALDEQERKEGENPAIGILLCRGA